MRGLQYYGNKDIRFSDNVKEPQIRVGKELIVDVAYCGICGTDLHEYLDGPIFFDKASKGGDELSNEVLPLCLGHEMSGIVSEIGSSVTTLKPGDHVVVEAAAHCRDRARRPDNNPRLHTATCQACLKGKTNCCRFLGFFGVGYCDGGFSERIAVSEDHAVKIPVTVPLDIAALVEPLAVAWHAARTANFKAGENALILGAGPIGLATLIVLKAFKANKIIVSEPAEIRRLQAEKLGVISFNPTEYNDTATCIEAIKTIAAEGINKAFDASGIKQTFDTGIGAIEAGGMVVNIAIWPDKPIDFKPMDVSLEEKYFTGSICYTRKDFEEVIEALTNGSLSLETCRHLITGKVKLENALEGGILELINNKAKHIKVLVSPHDIVEL